MAVSSGSTASTTAPCEAGAYCMAIAISSGKPMMEKTANAASRGHSRRCGGCGRAHSSVRHASAAASSERPAVTNSGSSSATASRVAGSVRPKIDDAEDAEQQGLALAAGLAIGARAGLAGIRQTRPDQPRLPPSTLREMTTRMISLVPSRIWCTRRSRTSFSRP